MQVHLCWEYEARGVCTRDACTYVHATLSGKGLPESLQAYPGLLAECSVQVRGNPGLRLVLVAAKSDGLALAHAAPQLRERYHTMRIYNYHTQPNGWIRHEELALSYDPSNETRRAHVVSQRGSRSGGHAQWLFIRMAARMHLALAFNSRGARGTNINRLLAQESEDSAIWRSVVVDGLEPRPGHTVRI